MSNLDIVDGWLSGDKSKARPTNISFATDEDAEASKEKKANCGIGDSYEDHDGKIWKKLGENSWASQPKVLTALRETNPRCKCCNKEVEYDHRYDVTAYGRSSMCFDCMVEIDSQRQVRGTFKKYEDLKMLHNQKGWVDDMLVQLDEALGNVDKNMEYINEFGDRERWTGLDKEKLREDINRDITEGKEALEKIANALEPLEKESEEEFQELRLHVLKQRNQVNEHAES
jgi:hypothetical protein